MSCTDSQSTGSVVTVSAGELGTLVPVSAAQTLSESLFVANANCLWPMQTVLALFLCGLFMCAAMGDWQVYMHEIGDQLGKHDQRLLNAKMAARG